MRPSPVRLEHYQLTSLSISPVDDYSPSFDDGLYPQFSDADFAINVRLGEADGDNDQRFLVHLELTGKPKEGRAFPYTFLVGADAFIKFHGQENDAQTLRDLVLVNGASMLYSALREVLFSLSGRFPNGPMMLPSANFIELREAAKAAKKVSDTRKG
jgi:preprotein translocase subunit SecB